MEQPDVFRKRKPALFEYIGVIIIFDKFRAFRALFWDSIRGAYNKAYKAPCDMPVQQWRDTTNINFLDIFVTKLSNLANSEATFDIEGDSIQVAKLKELCDDLEAKRFDITEAMLADGDYYCFPATDVNGAIKHSYLTQQQVRILNMNGADITDAYGIIDRYDDKNSKVYYLLRHHKLDDNGTLNISYSTVNGSGEADFLNKWADINGQAYAFTGAKHIGFGRYKSPKSSRGLSPIYGVPLNFGCAEIEKIMREDLKLINEQFRHVNYMYFKDCRAKLINDMSLYEKQIGTSKGILTQNEISCMENSISVKSANSDTMALIGRIRHAIDEGNKMTLCADGVYLNVRTELWSYCADWYDLF